MPLVAIDGPVGSGKSTVARLVGLALGVGVLETGAMYRAVAWAAIERGITPGTPSAAELARLAREVDIATGERVLVDGVDVTIELRSPAVGRAVSAVAAMPEVRAALVDRQRRWADGRAGAVVEGRDIGTVVFPGADLKVFLTATPEERAGRRGPDENAADVARRDHTDSSRPSSPLAVAADAVVIDTTGRPVDEVVAEILDLLADRVGSP